MNTVELNSINLQSIDVASNNVSSIGKSIKRNKGIKLLPKEYQQVEYIEGTGTQWIDTGLLFNEDIEYAVRFLGTTDDFSVRRHIVGTYVGGNRYRLSTLGDYATLFWWFGNSASQGLYSVDYVHYITDFIARQNNIKVYQNGTKIKDYDLTAEFTQNNETIKLFYSNDTDFYNKFIGRFYLFYAKNNNVLVRNLIPCYRKSDGEVGMYDVVNDVFYTNQGTGTFLKGADINEKYSPYIKGHITTSDSTFTFSVDGNNKTVPIDANGDFELKVKKPITSLSFISVPQLESLELFAINGVTTFDVDYPTAVSYIRCDSTTKNAKNDVYHIRGTATGDFDFTLKYVDGSNNVSTVTESAVIDGNGKWDVVYSGKYIYDMSQSLIDNLVVTELEFTEPLLKCESLTQLCRRALNLKKFIATNAVGNSQSVNMTMMFDMYTQEQTGGSLEIVDMPNFNVNANLAFMFRLANAKTININNISDGSSSDYVFYSSKATETIHAEKLVAATDTLFQYCNSLKNLYVSGNSTQQAAVNLRHSPLTYESMLRVAGWLKDLTGDTAQTVTFRAATYNALTAEQKAELEGIIVTQKGWVLATA